MAKPAREIVASLRAVRAELLGLNRERVAIITIVADNDLPEVVTFDGDIFIHDAEFVGTAYRRVRPFHAG